MPRSDGSSSSVSADNSLFHSNHPTDSPPSPTKPRRRPPPLFGSDPSDLIGRVLTSVKKSPNHPTLTLDFSDNTTFQILVDGYNPHPDYQGISKILEMDYASDAIFNPPGGVLHTDLTIRDCAMIHLSDRAFDSTQQWDQSHQGIVFKFGGENSWHCVWAALAEYDETDGRCIFRSYNDVYLESLQRSPRSPRKRQPRKKSFGSGSWK